MMQLFICHPSKSRWVNTLHFVSKSNNDWRLCREYGAFNKVTFPDRYYVPHLHDCSANLHGKIISSEIDLVKDYFQIPVERADALKTSIIMPTRKRTRSWPISWSY